MQRKLTLGFLIGLSLLCVMGCDDIDPLPMQRRKPEQKVTSEELSYFKDKYGLCYASVISYAYNRNYVVSIATVPCEKVGL